MVGKFFSLVFKRKCLWVHKREKKTSLNNSRHIRKLKLVSKKLFNRLEVASREEVVGKGWIGSLRVVVVQLFSCV